MSPVIDFRARPNTPEWARYLARRATPIRSETGTIFGSYHPPEETIGEFVAQLDRAGIDRAVFAARNRSSSDREWTLTNDFVAEYVRAFPHRIVGFGGIDATEPDRAAKEAHRMAVRGRMIAVAWRCENVFFENPFYHFAPGAGVRRRKDAV